jgi:CRP/FNR family transcriptional regulator, cyclic AMP receptor protein
MAIEPDELRGISLFASLREDELDRVAEWFDETSFSEGVTVAGEGAPGYSFFVIGEGTAVVSSDDDELARLGPGDFFGEVAMLGDGRRSATVPTTSSARLFVMFGTEFRRLQEAQPEIAARLEAAMAERVAER